MTTLLDRVSNDWYWIGRLIDIPESKRDMIDHQHSSDSQCSRACWEAYVNDHPFPTWQLLAEALHACDHVEELEVVVKKYLKGG